MKIVKEIECPFCDKIYHTKMTFNKHLQNKHGYCLNDASQYIKDMNIITEVEKAKFEKSQKTNIERYGAPNPFQVEMFKEQMRETWIENYGVDNPGKSEEVKNHMRITCLERYGVEYVQASEELKTKLQDYYNDKYGGPSPFCDPNVIKKCQATQRANYGGKLYCQSDHAQNGYKWYDYTLPSGKMIRIQGYENKAIDILLEKYDESDIVVNNCIKDHIGEIWYTSLDGKDHRYIPDIYIISENLLIEVKSGYTMKADKVKNALKKKSASEKCNFNFMVFESREADDYALI